MSIPTDKYPHKRGMTIEEISIIIGYSEAKTKSILYRAIRKIGQDERFLMALARMMETRELIAQ